MEPRETANIATAAIALCNIAFTLDCIGNRRYDDPEVDGLIRIAANLNLVAEDLARRTAASIPAAIAEIVGEAQVMGDPAPSPR